MRNDFLVAITQLSAEKNLPREVVLEAVEAALVSAFKKDASIAHLNIAVKIAPQSGEIKVYNQKTVSEEVDDPDTEISLDEALKLDPTATVGGQVAIETRIPPSAGRIAAQTAKQVVLQRLREAEREIVFDEYADKEGEIVSGVVQRVEPRQVIIDLGKAEAALPLAEQVRSEHYRPGQRLKVYLVEVGRSNKGPQVIVSRTHRNLLRRLFELEVPEISAGTVELKGIAREPGSRSKVAVAATQPGVDPVGSCVGMRGIRIQNIVNELNGERIDVVLWDERPEVYVANALSPAQVMSVTTDETANTATVVVPDRQLSLAIGKEGQNARLAAKLTGWRVDIKSASAAERDRQELLYMERAGLLAQERALTDSIQAVLDVQHPAPAETEEAPEPVEEAAEKAPAEPEERTDEAPAAVEEAEAPAAAVEASEAEAPPAEQPAEAAPQAAEEQPAEAAEPEQPEAEEQEEKAAEAGAITAFEGEERPLERPATIRFREDVLQSGALETPSGRGRARRGSRGRDDEREEVPDERGRPRRGRRPRRYEEEDDDEYADLIRRFT